MKERPILFSAPMVRAILSETKTQTRRIVKGSDGLKWTAGQVGILDPGPTQWNIGGNVFACPYGQPGDRLWVKESFRFGILVKGPAAQGAAISYGDENSTVFCHMTDEQMAKCKFKPCGEHQSWAECRKTPSIHMPRWASRITLEITKIRVERLQDISEQDAMAEGIERAKTSDCWMGGPHRIKGTRKVFFSPVQAYASLWNDINGPGSWDANPWVWVVEFRRIKS